jgi:hypothetical protein
MTSTRQSHSERRHQPPNNGALSQKAVDDYHADGFLSIPGFFSAEEIHPLVQALEDDPALGQRFVSLKEGDAVGSTDFMAWTGHADDFIGCLTRIERVIDAAEALIGEAVYHYHSKMVRKPSRSSGEIGWHQDFSGWYQDGCLFPDMLTCVIAVTPATASNGCLRMIAGSHKMGRIDRVAGTDSYYSVYPQRLEGILKRCTPVAIEMEPGDGLFFHGNTLHASSPNRTDKPRVLVELSYNAVSNAPVFGGQIHHGVKRLDKTPDTVLEDGFFTTVHGRTRFVNLDDASDSGYSIFHRDDFPAQC